MAEPCRFMFQSFVFFVLDVFVRRGHIHYPNRENGPGRIFAESEEDWPPVFPPPGEIKTTRLLFMGKAKKV